MRFQLVKSGSPPLASLEVASPRQVSGTTPPLFEFGVGHDLTLTFHPLSTVM